MEVKGKVLTPQELMKQFYEEEDIKIASLPWESDANKAFHLLEERIAQIEAIVFEAKARGARLTEKKRSVNRAGDLHAWNKLVVKKELADPRKKSEAKKKVELTKVEKMVAGYISLDYSDAEILESIPGKFFTRNEVWRAIEKSRGTVTRTLTPEQIKAIEEDKL